VWGNSTTSSIEGVKNIGQTSIVRVNDSIYQIVAITAADAAVDETIVPKFLDSLVVSGPHHPNGLAGLDRNETSDEKFEKFYKSLGRSMGMLLVLILVVGGIVRFMFKARRTPPSAPVSR
jgi:hypothetical protein